MSDFDILRGDEAVAALSEIAVSHKSIGFFQGPSWLRVWNALQGFECGLLILREGAGLVGCFPFCTRERFGFRECYSMPMGTYGGAVARPDIRCHVSGAFARWCRDSRFSRINVVEFAAELSEPLASFKTRPRMTQVLDLGRSTESLYEGLSDHHKRRLKKAGRFEYEIRSVNDESDVHKYFHVMEASVDRRGVHTRYDLDFYLALLQHVAPDELIWRLLFVDSKPCVGHICFRKNDEIMSWDGCSNRLGRATSVNYSLYWHNIREFSEHGCASFNFGTSPVGVESVVSFKTGWGATDVKYHEYDRQTLIYRTAHRVRSWFK